MKNILKKLNPFKLLIDLFDYLFLPPSLKKLKKEIELEKKFKELEKKIKKENENNSSNNNQNSSDIGISNNDQDYIEGLELLDKFEGNDSKNITVSEEEENNSDSISDIKIFKTLFKDNFGKTGKETEEKDIFLNYHKNFNKNKRTNEREKEKNIYQFSSYKLNSAIIKLIDELGKKKEDNNKKKNGDFVLSYENIEDIKIGNDIQKIIPNELLKLALNETEMQFYNDFYEKKLFEYEYEKIYDNNKNKNLIKGDIICCLDVSGSMSEQPIITAVNIIQKIIPKLIKEKRKFYLIFFREEIIFEKLIKSLQHFKNLISHISAKGGTDFFPPIQRAIELVKEKRDNDILFISDGCFESDLRENFKNFYKHKKEIDFKIHSIIIDYNNYYSKEDDDFKSVNQFSDKVYLIKK